VADQFNRDLPEPDEGIDAGRTARDRRGFFGFAGRVGISVVTAAAGLSALQRQARAQVLANWRCCNLAFGSPNCPINGSGSYYCNRGTMRTWYCCTGSRTYACGECTSGGDCESGTYYCSAGWTTNPNGCSTARSTGTPKADPAQLAAWKNGTYKLPTRPITMTKAGAPS
jgi:hypothetical protein